MKVMISLIREDGDKKNAKIKVIDGDDNETVLNETDNGNVVVDVPADSYIVVQDNDIA